MAAVAFLIAAIAPLFGIAAAVSPSPIDCNASGCSLRNYLGVWPDRIPCRAAQVFYPRAEEELLDAVAFASRNKLKMKVVSRWSQSIPKLVCPGGDSGVVISSRDLNSGIVVDPDQLTVTADAGVILRNLVDTVAEHGFAIPAATYWDGVSVAGAVGTGAHGSSLWGRGSALHDFVVGISLVVPTNEDGSYSKLVRVDSDSDEILDAAKLSLGVLGAISKVTFRLEPMFKRMVDLAVEDDAELEEQIAKFGRDYEFGDICWHPSLKKALFKMDQRVSAEKPGEGANKYTGFQAVPVQRAEQSRNFEIKIEQDKDTGTLCRISEMVLQSRIPSGNGYLNDAINFTGFPVIGYNNLMQTAGGCQYSPPRFVAVADATDISSTGTCEPEPEVVNSDVCSWDPRVDGSFYHQTAFSVGLDKVRELILDIKKLRDADPSSLCGLSLYGGIYLRYVKASSAYLGQNQDAVEFDITYYRSRDGGGGSPRLNEDAVEEIEQMGLVKYHGKPHWGKNRNIAFASVRDRVRDLDKFLSVKTAMDPEGLFSSEWSDAVLSGDRDAIESRHEHCALEGMCICSEDRHCAPERGYFCRPGKVFAAARVCRFEAGGEEVSVV